MLLITFSVFRGDTALLLSLLQWIETLGRCPAHDCLIVADAATPFDEIIASKVIAQRIFRSVEIITNAVSVDGWIEGPKSLFLCAAGYAQRANKPFLVLETDSIPLKPGWAEAIEAEYVACGKRFMGHVYASNNAALPPLLMSGIGVYAADTHKTIGPLMRPGVNWDISTASEAVPNAHNSKLIHHLWGEMNNPPVFGDVNIPGTAQFCLKQVPAEAMIWHRDKTHSLIRCLRRRDYPHTIPEPKPIVVVFPVAQDIGLAIAHAHWMRKMEKVHAHKAVIAFDATCDMHKLNEFRNLIAPLFISVELFTYPIPPVRAWPNAPNWAWQNVANHMSRQESPWLWMEADAIALKPDWLERLQAEYARAKHLFMGPKVTEMGSHVNGVAIYCADAAQRLPKAMTATSQAWDYVAQPEMSHDTHNARHMMGHFWSVIGDDAVGVGGGNVPQGVRLHQAQRWITPGMVLCHRIKDNSVLDLLMSGQLQVP